MAWRKPATAHEWFALLGRHKKKTFFPVIAVMLVVVLGSFGIPREYRAEAKFERVSDSSMEGVGNRNITSIITPLRKSLMEDLGGKGAMDRLIEDVGLTRGFPHSADGSLTFQGQQLKNDLIIRLQSQLRISPVQSDAIDQITVSFADPNRDLAPKVANQLVENYIRETRKKLDEYLLMGKAFFEKEVDRYRGTVADLEAKVVRFKMNHAGLLPDDPLSYQNKKIEVKSQLDRIVRELETAKSQRTSLEAELKTMPDEIVKKQTVQNPRLLQLQAERADLDRALNEHLNKFGRTEDHPLVKQTRKQMAELDKQIIQTEAMTEGPSTSEPNMAKKSYEQEIARLSGTVTALTKQRDDLTDQLEKYDMLDRGFEADRAEYVRLQRDLEESTDQLKFWDTNLNRTIIALKQELGAKGVQLNFRQRADIAKASKPTLLGVIATALALGLGLGAVIVLLAELTDHSFRTVDQAVDEIKLPVLGAVTEIATPAEMMRRKIFGWAVFPAIGTAMLLVLVVSGYLVYLNLQDNQRFDQLMRRPAQFIFEQLGGHTG